MELAPNVLLLIGVFLLDFGSLQEMIDHIEAIIFAHPAHLGQKLITVEVAHFLLLLKLMGFLGQHIGEG